MIGCDIGTAFISSARVENGKNVIKTVRNCFVCLDDLNVDIGWLKENIKATIIDITDDDGEIKSYIVGEDAINLPNVNIRRPMKSGILNSSEDDAVLIISKLIEMVCGHAKFDGEIACGSIPSTTILNRDPTNHKKVIEKIFTNLGYTFVPINEGLAIIYATNPKIINESGEQMNFVGAGLSLGGGQINFCHSYLGIPTENLTFSLENSGDWIDSKTSQTLDHDAAGNPIFSPIEVARFKEKYLDLTRDSDSYTNEELDQLGFKNSKRKKNFRKMHFALSSYYEELINFIIANFIDRFKKSGIQANYSIEIVIAGGTSKPNGVVEKFEKILNERGDFPFDIKCVRRAEDPLYSTVLGALTKAKSEEKKRGISPPEPPKKSKKEEEIKPDDQPE